MFLILASIFTVLLINHLNTPICALNNYTIKSKDIYGDTCVMSIHQKTVKHGYFFGKWETLVYKYIGYTSTDYAKNMEIGNGYTLENLHAMHVVIKKEE